MSKYVKCIATEKPHITKDRIYVAYHEDNSCYAVINDENKLVEYYKYRFTDATPEEISAYLSPLTAHRGDLTDEVDNPKKNQSSDMVNHPPHYTLFPMELKDWNFEVIKTIQDKHYATYFKTISEYIHRAHLKNGVEDLEKAVFWLQDCINHVKDNKIEIK